MSRTIGLPVSEIEDITRRDFLVGGRGCWRSGSPECGSGESGEPSGETRTVESPVGPVELPVEPERLVPGYTTEIDYALVLDLPLAAATGATGARTSPRRLPARGRAARPPQGHDLPGGELRADRRRGAGLHPGPGRRHRRGPLRAARR